MPSPKMARLQDEAAAVTAEIETLRAATPADEAEDASIQERLAERAKRAEEIGKESAAERELDSRLEVLRSVVAGSSTSKSEIETVQKKERSPVNVRHFESAADARVAGEFLRSLYRGETRAWGETSPTYDEQGAELTVPAELYGSVINVLNRQSAGAQVALVVNTVAKKITLPKVGDATAAFYAEAGELTAGDIATAGVDVTLFGLRSAQAVSNDQIEDSPFDVASILSGAFGNGFASKVDYAWLQGDETAGIAGLVGEVENEVSVANAGATTAAKLADLVGMIDPAAMNTAWVVSPAGMGALLAAHAGTSSVVMADAMRPSVFGRPVYVTNGLPSGTLALYGDFSMATAIAVRASGLRIDALRELRAMFDQTVFVAKQRIGIANHAPEFVAKLSID